MDVNVGGFNFSTCSSASASATHSSDAEDNNNNAMDELRRGPWTVEEDLTLINYISNHGEGRWNSLARCAGLKRTGKSCRLRWLNYLRPDVRRGNITLEEQLMILELHSRWGNRWSKIAQHLPGRTDNEIKNYWRTRVQKHAKQLQCDVNSKQFKDTMRYLWMPRLVERIQAAAAASSSSSSSSATHHLHVLNKTQEIPTVNQLLPAGRGGHINTCFTPENSSTAASSDSLPSDLKDYYAYQTNNNGFQNAQSQHNLSYGSSSELCNSAPYFNQGQGQGLMIQSEGGEQTQPQPQLQPQHHQSHQNMWFGGEDTVENSWNIDDLWFLQQRFCNGN